MAIIPDFEQALSDLRDLARLGRDNPDVGECFQRLADQGLPVLRCKIDQTVAVYRVAEELQALLDDA